MSTVTSADGTAIARNATDSDSRRRPTYKRDPRVDAYIKPLPAWQQQLCRQLRDLNPFP
jgi:hypothetical protein